MDKCNKIAEKEEIEQRQKFIKESKQPVRKPYSGNRGKGKSEIERVKIFAFYFPPVFPAKFLLRIRLDERVIRID